MITSNCLRILQNQYVAAFTANICIMMTGAGFTWVTPVLPLFEGPDPIIRMTSTEASWMVSFVEVGALVAPIPTGIIGEKYGRKLGVVFGAPFLIAGWLVILLTRTVEWLYLARIFHGIGMGVVYTVMPMYLGEIASVNVRGGLTGLLQTMWYVGFLFQYAVGAFLSYNNSAIINIILCTIFFTFFVAVEPESPVYYTIMKNEDAAIHSLMLLRGKTSLEEVVTEMEEIKRTVEKDMKNNQKWSEIRLASGEWKILILVQLMTTFRGCSGTIGITTYLSELLRKAEWQLLSSELCMVIFGSLTVVSIIIALFTVDKLGRRPLMILSCIGSALSNAAIAIFYFCQDNTDINLDPIRWLPLASMISFAFFFSMGLGPVTQTIQSELFPTHLRGLGSVVTTFNMIVSSFVVLRFYQPVVDVVGVYGNFVFYLLICIIAALVILFYMPETKGKTFLEISDYFNGTNYAKENNSKEKDIYDTCNA